MKARLAALAPLLVPALMVAACDRPAARPDAGAATVSVTLHPAGGPARALTVEAARTEAEQAKGLMYRANLPRDGGMLFFPYPPDGGPPRVTSFWMKNTPSALDIVFLRRDGTVARIAENTVPFSEAPVPSGEPVAAVLELAGGRAAELGLSEGDRVDLPAR